MAQRKYAEAEALLREALAGQEKKDANSWQRYDIQGMLGATLAPWGNLRTPNQLELRGCTRLVETGKADGVPGAGARGGGSGPHTLGIGSAVRQCVAAAP